jgi:oligosaccharide repeat unit polymerase
MSQPLLTAIVAGLLAGTLFWLGRQDLTRAAVTFGVPWFGLIAVAQLRLTSVEHPWSTGFTFLAIGGGLAFVVAATLAQGTPPNRGIVAVNRQQVREQRLVFAALVLVAGGVAGVAYKAHVLGAIPLLSDNPDVVRGSAVRNGDAVLPPWSSALTNGLYLGMWCVLAALWVGREGRSRARVVGLWLLAVAALAGVCLEASRNVVLFALVVPGIAAYLLAGPRGRASTAAWIAAAICVLAVGVGGLFVARLMRADSAARTYIETELDRHPPALRPLVPVYINAVFPIEAARRLYGAVPNQIPYGFGGNSLVSLPAAFFPEGKPSMGSDVGALMRTGTGEQLTWTVATYQGPLIADLGWQGVVLGSLLLGLAFGALQRWARRQIGFLAVAVIAYVAYYSAYMLYDNLLSFTVIAVYDLAVIAVVDAVVTGQLDSPIRSLVQAFRQPAVP